MVDLFVDEYLPISWPEKPSVRKFHSKVTSGWKRVCKKNVRTNLIKKRDPFEFDFKSYMENLLQLLTFKRQDSAASLHLQRKPEFQTKVMDVAHLPTPHNAANIRAKFGEVLSVWKERI